jgi:hypothetical protein
MISVTFGWPTRQIGLGRVDPSRQILVPPPSPAIAAPDLYGRRQLMYGRREARHARASLSLSILFAAFLYRRLRT